MYNKILLIGNLGKDGETKTFNNGGKLINLALATSESWKDKASGDWKERTDWHNITISGRLAEALDGKLLKGARCLVEGRLRNEKYENQAGETKYRVYILADKVRKLDKAPDNQTQSSQNDYRTSPKPQPEPSFTMNEDDDLPF